ncbi:MAG: LysE family transporter [Spirochaetaceae bacterium]|jgi:threonine/homoserine/homoserine lactone efflux protein|nr:LysE family transporter [Spirochaetaceae bacterium]
MSFTPGPNNIMSMNNAKNAGFKEGLKFNFGILVGCLFIMGLCLAFSSVLYNLVPKVQFPMKILGAAYLVFLIVKTIVPSKEHETASNNGRESLKTEVFRDLPLKNARFVAQRARNCKGTSKNNRFLEVPGSFIIGALLQFINPKMILYGITVMSSYILPYYKEIPILVIFVFLLSLMSFISTICWALFGSLFSVMFNKHKKLLDIIMAILLLYCAISLFI